MNNPGIRSEKQWDELFQINNKTSIVEKRNIFPVGLAENLEYWFKTNLSFTKFTCKGNKQK